jgi:hypothetical protein
MNEILEAALKDAHQYVSDQLNVPVAESDPEYQRYLARVYRTAGQQLTTGVKSVVEAAMELMVIVERGMMYYFDDQELSSLAEWAQLVFAELIEDEVLTWDYLQRFASSVTRMIVPAERQRIPHPETGEPITANDLMRASKRALKEMPYSFDVASDETRAEIAVALVSGAKPARLQELKEKALADQAQDEAQNGTALPSEARSVPVLSIQYREDGKRFVFGEITEGQLLALEVALKNMFRFEIVGEFENG